MQEYYDLWQELSQQELPLINSVSGLIAGNRRPNPTKCHKQELPNLDKLEEFLILKIETNFIILGIL
jgi:hypothetical protein